MSARYEIRWSSDRKHYWTLQGNNNETLITSETYNSESAAKNGIESAKRNSPLESRYHKGTASNGQYYFTLRAENYETLGTSETYTTSSGRDNGIEATKRVGPTAPVVNL